MHVIYGIFNPIVNYKLKCQFPIIDTHKPSLYREYICGIFFCVFYCSISLSLFFGVVSHLFSINISWGSTVKSLENDTRCKTIKNIFINEKVQIIYSLSMLVLTIILRIYFNMALSMMFTLLSLSLGHFLVPFILNPPLWCSDKYEFDVIDTPVNHDRQIL
jgi:hypothetical protein